MLTPPPTFSRSDQDERPSMRVRVAVAMLRDDPAADADPHSQARPAELLSPQLNDTQARHVRWRARIAVAALLGWIANLGLSATADIAQLSSLGLASLILTPVLVAVLVLHATSRRSPGSGSGQG